MAHYPADTFQEATEIAIEASNQLHGVINGDANAEVTVEDGSKIPSVRKAMVDSLYFKPPIAWAQGEYEDTYNQLREFVDGDVRTWWFAKGATVSTPVLMTTNPATDVNWTLWSAVTLNAATYKTQKRLAAEAGLNMVGSFLLGGTVTTTNDVVFYETDGKYYGWSGSFPKVVSAGATPATSGGIGAGAWVDRNSDTLRTDLASYSGSSIVGFKQLGLSAVSSTVQEALHHQAINMLDFYNVSDGADYYPALTRAVTAIRTGLTKSRTLLIPQTETYWPVSQQVLFNLSNFTLLLHGNVQMMSTTAQKTLLFSYDTNPQPAQMLTNVCVLGNGSFVDGNGNNMIFEYYHGMPNADNYSAIRFNYIRGLVVDNVVANNGAVDSMSLRQCQKWLVSNCEFKNSKEDNGFSATTDFATYVRGDWTTYGYGWVVNCIAHNNNDFGMTAYNCAGVKFIGCRSYANNDGYSYEDNYSAPNSKIFDGLFSDCIAFNNTSSRTVVPGGRGFYVDASGVTIDDNCKSYGNTYTGSDVNNIHGNGVVISSANNIYVGGEHTYNQKAGLAIFNGATMNMDIVVSGKFNSNNWHGIYARGVSQLAIKPRTECRFNGLTLVNGMYGRGIHVDNTGATFLQGTGLLQIESVILSNNGVGAIYSRNVKSVRINNVLGTDNSIMGAEIGIDVHDATTAVISNCQLFSGGTAQTFAYAIEASVINGHAYSNIGDGIYGVGTNLASGVKQYVRGELIGSAVYDASSLIDGAGITTTVPVAGATLGDFALASLNIDVAGISVAAWVSATNVVSVRLQNESGGTLDLASGTIRAMVFKRNAG